MIINGIPEKYYNRMVDNPTHADEYVRARGKDGTEYYCCFKNGETHILKFNPTGTSCPVMGVPLSVTWED